MHNWQIFYIKILHQIQFLLKKKKDGSSGGGRVVLKLLDCGAKEPGSNPGPATWISDIGYPGSKSWYDWNIVKGRKSSKQPKPLQKRQWCTCTKK